MFSLLFCFAVVSVTGKRGAGIPIVLLHDSMGGIVTVELKNGSVYRGTLDDAQDNMNCLLKDCVRVNPDGQQAIVEVAYIRGSQISFIVVPSMLKRAPFFTRITKWREFKGNAVLGLNTAAINAMPRGFPPRGGGGFGGGGRGGGFGGRGGGRGDYNNNNNNSNNSGGGGYYGPSSSMPPRPQYNSNNNSSQNYSQGGYNQGGYR